MTNELDEWLQAHPHTVVRLVLIFRPLAGDTFVDVRQVKRFARRLRRRIPGLGKAEVQDARRVDIWIGKPVYHDTKATFLLQTPNGFAPQLSDQDIQMALASDRVNSHRIALLVHKSGYNDMHDGPDTKHYKAVYFYQSPDVDSPAIVRQHRDFYEQQTDHLRQWWAKYARPMW